MKITSLKLKGFIGIKKGLGLDEVSLDLSDIDGLIALDGPNGKGKTTVLENMQPYRSLASRKKALQHHVFLRDSYRELVFELDGHQYQTTVKIDAQSGKQEGFIIKDGISQVIGKCPDYDQYITNLLGSNNLFFNSVFCAQNSDRISDMTTGQLKELFSEFLRLYIYIQHENTSKQAGIILNGKLDIVNRSIEKLNESVSKLKQTQDEVNTQTVIKIDKETKLQKLNEALTEAEESLKADQKIIELNKLTETRLADIEKTKKLAEEDLEKETRQKENELTAIRDKAKKTMIEIESLEKILSNKAEIEKAVENERAVTIKVSNSRRHLQESDKNLSQISTTINEQEKKHIALSTKLKDIDNNGQVKILETEIKNLEVQTSALTLRGNDPNCPDKNAICGFVSLAHEASEKLPEIREQLINHKTDLHSKHLKITAEIQTIEKEILDNKQTHKSEKEMRDNYEKAIDQMEKRLEEEIRPLSSRADKINVAQANLENLKVQKEDITSEGMATKDKWDKRKYELMQRISNIKDLINELKSQINYDVEKRIDQMKLNIEKFKSSIRLIEKEISNIEAEINTFNQKIHDIEKDKVALEKAEGDYLYYNNEISEWKYLQWACGKDALRALEIDSVAPAISSYANELLNQTFGPMFSVRFRTQDEETNREVLDILVIREDGSEVLLDNLSGGEKVWLLKSLRLAMTLISKEKSARNYKTLLCDEEDGALSRDNAVQFIMLYRSLLRMAGMDTCFYISHRPEALDLADHRILFNGSGLSIE